MSQQTHVQTDWTTDMGLWAKMQPFKCPWKSRDGSYNSKFIKIRTQVDLVVKMKPLNNVSAPPHRWTTG